VNWIYYSGMWSDMLLGGQGGLLGSFFYDGEQLQDLGRQSLPLGINDAGQIVGGTTTWNARYAHAFLRNASGMHDLGTLPGELSSVAYDINNRGQIVGTSVTDLHMHRIFLFADGRMQDLGPIIPPQSPSGYHTLAYAINDRGQIIGTSGPVGAFLLTPEDVDGDGTPDVWFEPDPANSSHNRLMKPIASDDLTITPTALNNAGDVVGCRLRPGDNNLWFEEAILSSGQRVYPLGTLGISSRATGINDSDQIVGYGKTTDGRDHAFLWQGGRRYDVNDLLPAGSGWFVGQAAGVNQAGQIVCNRRPWIPGWQPSHSALDALLTRCAAHGRAAVEPAGGRAVPECHRSALERQQWDGVGLRDPATGSRRRLAHPCDAAARYHRLPRPRTSQQAPNTAIRVRAINESGCSAGPPKSAPPSQARPAAARTTGAGLSSKSTISSIALAGRRRLRRAARGRRPARRGRSRSPMSERGRS